MWSNEVTTNSEPSKASDDCWYISRVLNLEDRFLAVSHLSGTCMA